MLDILLFRDAVGGNSDLIRESQRRRYTNPETVDAVIQLDEVWRRAQYLMEQGNKAVNLCSSTIAAKKKAKEADGTVEDIPEDVKAAVEEGKLTAELTGKLCCLQLKALSKYISTRKETLTTEAKEAELKRERMMHAIGNIVHESVPVGADEDACNKVERMFGDTVRRMPLSHIDVMLKLGGMDTGAAVTAMAGGRAYVLKGGLVQLQMAVSAYAMAFLGARGYIPFFPPFFLNKDAMAEVAQLSQFDDELYKVSGEGEDKYLTATSEQSIAAYHRGRWYQELKEPIKYAGYSTCFRKEVGSHGRDTLGIFRVHQFDKIEQFVVCSPRDNISWKLMDEMIGASEEFYQSLGLPYRVINICSGALNNAAAKKFDLEAWFPGSGAFRELVSCSNCTDYQARRLNTRYGPNASRTSGVNVKEHPHMLNSTLCAVTRTMCCIAENYQTEEGVVIPEVLRPFMGGQTILKYADATKWIDPAEAAAAAQVKAAEAAKAAKAAAAKPAPKK